MGYCPDLQRRVTVSQKDVSYEVVTFSDYSAEMTIQFLCTCGRVHEVVKRFRS